MAENTTELKNGVNVRVSDVAHKLLTLRAALGNESMSEIVDKAIKADCARYPKLMRVVNEIADEDLLG